MQKQNITCSWNYDNINFKSYDSIYNNGYPVLNISTIIRSYDCSPNESQVICGLDNIIRTFDYQQFKIIGNDLIGHLNNIGALKYSQDGLLIASGSGDTRYFTSEEELSVRVWDSITRGQVSQNLLGHTRAILSVLFSPDAELVISGSNDRTIRVWNWKLALQINQINTSRILVQTISSGLNIVACRRCPSLVCWAQYKNIDSKYSMKNILLMSRGYNNTAIRINYRLNQKYSKQLAFRTYCKFFDYQPLGRQFVLTTRLDKIFIIDAMSRKLTRRLTQKGTGDIRFPHEYRFIVTKCDYNQLSIIPYSY